jgi:hypothetical protein
VKKYISKYSFFVVNETELDYISGEEVMSTSSSTDAIIQINVEICPDYSLI